MHALDFLDQPLEFEWKREKSYLPHVWLFILGGIWVDYASSGNSFWDSTLLVLMNLILDVGITLVFLNFILHRAVKSKDFGLPAIFGTTLAFFALGMLNSGLFYYIGKFFLDINLFDSQGANGEKINPLRNLTEAIFFLIISTAALLVNRWYMDARKYQAQLALLRYQIDRHTLFNMLNNLYSQADKNEDSVANKLYKLSTLMRHILYGKSGQLIALKEEIKSIRHFIDLRMLSYPENSVHLELDLPNLDNWDVEVAPQIFLPFIENAFKHGIDPSIDNRWIKIRLEVSPQRALKFKCQNSLPERNQEKEIQALVPGIDIPKIVSGKRPKKDTDNGIGINNTISRLNRFYPKAHTLKIDDKDPNKYTIHLSIDLRHGKNSVSDS
jgi:sensor histidine kinase YesM